MIIKMKINYKKKTATGNFNEELNSIDQSKKKIKNKILYQTGQEILQILNKWEKTV